MSRTALIVVDMLSSYDFPDADKVVRSVERVLPNVARLIERAGEEDVLTVFVNDNFGVWRSNRDDLVERAMTSDFRHLVEPIVPAPDTLFVVKARHSIFYETPLEYLLRQEGVDRIVLTGQVTEQCILYSALDAYIRHLQVVIPRDAVAEIHPDLADAALRMMETNMRAELCTAEDVRLRDDGPERSSADADDAAADASVGEGDRDEVEARAQAAR